MHVHLVQRQSGLTPHEEGCTERPPGLAAMGGCEEGPAGDTSPAELPKAGKVLAASMKADQV